MVTHNRLSPLVSAIVFACAASAHADIVGYTDFDEWSAATGEFTTIDFAGWPEATVITDQYSESGVTFIDGNDWIWNAGEGTFPNDGSGLHGNQLDLQITIEFDSPQLWIGIDHPGSAAIDLFSGDVFLGTFHNAIGGPGGIGGFTGILAYMPFDRAIIHRPQTNNPAVIDDLHFGIPTPGAIAVLAVAGLFGTGSRRRCRAPTLDTGDPYRPGDN